MQLTGMFNRLLVFSLIIFVFLLTPYPAHAHGVTPLQDPSPLVAHGTDKRGLLTVTLRANRAVAPGETVTLLFEVTPTLAADALTMQWRLPDGGELVGSAETVLPNVTAKETITLQRQVRFGAAGVYQVSATAGYAVGEPLQVAAVGVLVFTVQPDGAAVVTHHDPRIDISQQRIIPTTVTVEDGVRAADANGDPCFTINGVVTRLERTPIPSSPMGTPAYMDSRVPVRNVPVDMMEEDTLFDDYYGTRLTDANGNFNFSFCDDDGWFDDELELYVLLRAEIWDGQGRKIVEVEDSSWIDEVHEFESGRQESEGGTLRFDMEFDRNYNPANVAAGATFGSEVFNIADAVYSAWLFWNANGGAAGDDAIFADTAEVHYEPGYDDDGSYYNPFWNEITVADAAGDPDGWDDSVIIHEWTHFADDVYGCDDTPGGDHSFFANTNDTELAWSEGYSNYYQSAVRAANGDPNGNTYIDINGGGRPGTANLESWNTISTTLNSVFNEGAIAAMLWDLQDGVNDGNDRVGYGHRVTQEVFTDPAFESNGDIFDDTCNVYVYLRAWRQMGRPATRDTAAAISQNIGYTPPDFNGLMAAAQQVNAASLQAVSATDVAPNALATDYRWWKQLTWVVDNSTSMAGAKLDGAKTVINEQLNDLNNDPKGVDFNLYTFNHESNANRKIFENEFYADRITPAINGLATTSSNDLDCGSYVYGLQAMKQALLGKRAGDLWLFTDGRDAQLPRVDTVVQQLNRQQVKGSIALLGGCASPPLDPNRLNGTETYLGNAAGPQSSGIVPYLVTAVRSGGQFLFVNPDQIGLASDILRAQLANSAGAGRWSDYVSDFPLYRFDKLDANEYRWINTLDTAGGAYHGQPDDKAIQVFLPQPFTVWGQTTSSVWSNDDGYILMGNQLDSPTLDVLYNSSMLWKYRVCGPNIVAASPTADVPCSTRYVQLYSKQEGDWFAITTTGVADNAQNSPRAYQVLLNATTGEIRYQYQALAPTDAGQAEIAVTDIANNRRMLVSNKDTNGAAAGYKFYWAPPQPAKTFTVAVDKLMDGIGFLLTGYSGDFEPMLVRTPDGNAVNCADTANVLCLNLGKVQYIQVNVNGRAGDWTATVDAAAPSNQGTFSFIAVAASTVGAEVLSDHSLYSKGAHRILVKLGRTADNNVLTGWFQKPNGVRWGSQFSLYDDGAHDDLFAGDGYFGSDGITPGVGAAYLWVSGAADGVAFQRADPVLFNFQPFQLVATETRFSNDNDTPTAVGLTLTNGDNVYHCFEPDVTVPEQWAAWSYNWDYDQLGPLCLGAGETRQHTLTIYPAWYEAPSGSTGEVTVSFSDVDNPGIDDSATVTFMRQRTGVNVQIDNEYHATYIRPNGVDTVTLQVAVFDEQGVFVADDTPVQIETTLGTVNPTVGATQGGLVKVTFTAGSQEGDATITASVGQATDNTVLHLRNPLPDTIDLVATPTDLSGSSTTATLVATVRDRWGDPLANQSVRLGMSGDGQLGTLTGETEVMTLTTDANGQVTALFTKGAEANGAGDVRADLLVLDNGQQRAVHTAQVSLNFGGNVNPNQPNALYLPIVTRDGAATVQPDLVIFADAPMTAWEDWSWDSTTDLASTALAHDGSQAIAITHNASHAGFSLRSPTAIDATQYSAIRFWIYGSGNGNLLLLYTEAGDEGPVSPQQHAFTAPAGAWTQMTVPLSALGNPTVIKRVTLQENGGAAQGTYYVDDLRLVGR